jgi:ribonuclease VapC
VSIFVDASAIVAMLAREPDALTLAERLDEPTELLWSPIVCWEVVAALARIRAIDCRDARSDVLEFGREWSFTLVSIGERENNIAFEAFRIYGKGHGHPAQLNMGDCFAYACAKTNNARLLYKGDDFSKTDLA